MSRHRIPVRRSGAHWNAVAGAGAVALALVMSNQVVADSRDGIFPTADQVGGEVFPKGLQVGEVFPTDWDMYGEDGKKVDVATKLKGKRSVVAFFITGVPISVKELKKIQAAGANSKQPTQMLFVNADTVGTALLGGPNKQLGETIRTVNVIKREEGLQLPMYVAPNDALSPKGLSNRIGFRGLPTVFVIDAHGKVEKIYVGPQDWNRSI